ncbi:hypothetical protein N7510_008894 [Penicillium lagena]|uniref:uncharacterized protein n=1 Tax=Penicillium lagena TaxID=94218 RepID=UPI002540E417|nr:uncharacterized protein N7510_008894 [Penicillium lagena]KAJ5606113.1 hypothetical protein N7510_008894 [Penicillium lagena]
MAFIRGFALYVTVLSSLFLTTRSCPFHEPGYDISKIDWDAKVANNIAARALSHHQASPGRIAINNVRVFDGSSLLPPATVIIEDGKIGGPCSGEACNTTQSYDGQGKTLLPGLMDAHAHPADCYDLGNMTQFGITTSVNAFCLSPKICQSLTNYKGLTYLVSASFFATVSGSEHAALISPNYDDLLIGNTSVAESWVAGQIKGGADFIKLIGSAPLRGSPPVPGLSQAEQAALVMASHKQGKQVVLHTSSYESYEQGLKAGVDQIHHSTLDMPIDDKLLALFKIRNSTKVVCPTLTMMRAIPQQNKTGSYAPAADTVRILHKAGIPIIAGTDSNSGVNLPAMVKFGTSLHDEMENLVEVGLSPVEALNAATIMPAQYFGLNDRGVIKEGMRADLLLVDGDPTKDISATRNIVKVWVEGMEFNATVTKGMCAKYAAKEAQAREAQASGTTSAGSTKSTSTSTAGAMRVAATLLPAGLLAYMALQ